MRTLAEEPYCADAHRSDAPVACINSIADPQIGNDGRTFNFASCPLFIGVDADSGCTGLLNGYLDAAIDKVQVHASALTASEIQQMMTMPLAFVGGRPNTTPPVRSSSDMILQLPSGTTQATLTLFTNEPASCRSSLSPDVSVLEHDRLVLVDR